MCFFSLTSCSSSPFLAPTSVRPSIVCANQSKNEIECILCFYSLVRLVTDWNLSVKFKSFNIFFPVSHPLLSHECRGNILMKALIWKMNIIFEIVGYYLLFEYFNASILEYTHYYTDIVMQNRSFIDFVFFFARCFFLCVFFFI